MYSLSPRILEKYMKNSQQTEEHVGDDKTITQDLAIAAKRPVFK